MMAELYKPEQESVVRVYSGEEYLDLVKSGKARQRWNVARKSRAAMSPSRLNTQAWRDAADAARKLKSAGTYARHQEALRVLEEDEKRQREIAMQNRKVREEEKFSKLMSRCSEAIEASRELETFLDKQNRIEQSKRERRYCEWTEKVFAPIKDQIASNLTEESFLALKATRKAMHEEYLCSCDKPNGVFLLVPGPAPKEINMRYSTKEIRDPIKADLEKDAAEKKLVAARSPAPKNANKGLARALIDPTDYLKVTPTRRRVVYGPASHERILPNDYTEKFCDNEVVRCEMFSCRKRLFYVEDDPDILADVNASPRLCEACECQHTRAVISPKKLSAAPHDGE